MATKYIVNNVSGQTITGDLTISGNLNTTSVNNGRTYRALLTQTGSISGASGDFNNRLIIGETYGTTDYATYDDFSNVANVLSGGTLNFDYVGTATGYGAVSGVTGTTSGFGSGASFDVFWCGTTYNIINVVNSGADYIIGDTITILGADVSGSTPANDITITVTSLTPNSSGSVFIATGDTPLIWGDTVLTSVGGLVVDVLENTLGDDLVWFYDSELFTEGLYVAVFSDVINNNILCNSFPKNKTQINTPSLITNSFNYFFESPQYNLIMLSGVGNLFTQTDDVIYLSVYDIQSESFSGNTLYYTPIEIKLNTSITQEETPLISINWVLEGGNTNFDSNSIEIPTISNVTRLTTSKCGSATAHVHSDYESSDLTIDLYDDSISEWVTVWSYTLYNQNYDLGDSPDLYFPGNIDVTFANITSVSGIRVTSDPASGDSFHDWEGLIFNFFN
jgi:hypothetical protein